MRIRKLGKPKIVIQQEASESGDSGVWAYLLDYIVPGLIFFAVLRLLAWLLEWWI